ncbi:peptidoglycan DD-metalloendopeptidase family protein [Paenibacillus yanchengensis]|uniref:Peptidoglycan DD-metalloendopeptidase family protein n=1 Tax=Paenibacillus yanchengensis TaxID=2035833 RepID=A0ABW4YLI6_9BACL
MMRADQHVDQNQPTEKKKKVERDPEKAWKNNPNPWQKWDQSSTTLSKSNYIKEPDWSRYSTNHKKMKWWHRFTLKLLIAVALFLSVWTMFQSDQKWAQQGQAAVRRVLTEELNFTAVATWYNENFTGSPSLLPSFSQQREEMIKVDAPVQSLVVSPLEEGSLISTFAELLNGVELAAPALSPVRAMENGRIILVSEEQATIIIQHANKRISIYTGIGAEVRVNDWVEAGEMIGSLPASQSGSHSLLYFAIKEDDKYIDPLDVISID